MSALLKSSRLCYRDHCFSGVVAQSGEVSARSSLYSGPRSPDVQTPVTPVFEEITEVFCTPILDNQRPEKDRNRDSLQPPVTEILTETPLVAGVSQHIDAVYMNLPPKDGAVHVQEVDVEVLPEPEEEKPPPLPARGPSTSKKPVISSPKAHRDMLQPPPPSAYSPQSLSRPETPFSEIDENDVEEMFHNVIKMAEEQEHGQSPDLLANVQRQNIINSDRSSAAAELIPVTSRSYDNIHRQERERSGSGRVLELDPALSVSIVDGMPVRHTHQDRPSDQTSAADRLNDNRSRDNDNISRDTTRSRWAHRSSSPARVGQFERTPHVKRSQKVTEPVAVMSHPTHTGTGSQRKEPPKVYAKNPQAIAQVARQSQQGRMRQIPIEYEEDSKTASSSNIQKLVGNLQEGMVTDDAQGRMAVAYRSFNAYHPRKVVQPRIKRHQSDHIVESKVEHYGLMGKTGEGSRIETVDDIPENIDGLTVDDVCQCLRLLDMNDHIYDFKRHQIDGRLLDDMKETTLLSDFGFTPFNASKIMRFTRGWRPKIA